MSPAAKGRAIASAFVAVVLTVLFVVLAVAILSGADTKAEGAAASPEDTPARPQKREIGGWEAAPAGVPQGVEARDSSADTAAQTPETTTDFFAGSPDEATDAAGAGARGGAKAGGEAEGGDQAGTEGAAGEAGEAGEADAEDPGSPSTARDGTLERDSGGGAPLSELDASRARAAAANFILYAYGYTGTDREQYEAYVNQAVVPDEFYASPGAVHVRDFAEAVGTGGTESTATLEEFEILDSGEGEAAGEAAGVATFTLTDDSGTRRLGQELSVAALDSVWRVTWAGRLRG
ncbi:MAG: hypothetical protein M3P49_04150, partial [Actinomycetota bacterium]|nr:hypothetical protein [Actinomycetota bacterium]